ncbi:partial Nitrate import ATP-binding protein NrtC, partial [Anaerolineae bacterium]
MKPYVAVDHVDVIFDTKSGPFQALANVNAGIAKGEFVSIIGHSGCGKSTVLNLIAGLLNATTGCVLLEDREIKGPGPERAVVFQNHSLLPWL